MLQRFRSATPILGMVVLLMTAMMAAGAEAPATAPAASFATPMDALRAHKDAIARGDAVAFFQCYVCDSVDQAKAVKSIGQSFAAMIAFRQACIDKFGADQAKRVRLGITTSIPEDAYEEINGDKATIHNVGGTKPLELNRVDGKWKLTYASLVENNFRDLPKLDPKVMAGVFEISTATYKGLADDTKAGKFKTAAEASDALRQHRNEIGEKVHALIAEQKEAVKP
jgi:hypothetical protein